MSVLTLSKGEGWCMAEPIQSVKTTKMEGEKIFVQIKKSNELNLRNLVLIMHLDLLSFISKKIFNMFVKLLIYFLVCQWKRDYKISLSLKQFIFTYFITSYYLLTTVVLTNEMLTFEFNKTGKSLVNNKITWL